MLVVPDDGVAEGVVDFGLDDFLAARAPALVGPGVAHLELCVCVCVCLDGECPTEDVEKWRKGFKRVESDLAGIEVKCLLLLLLLSKAQCPI